MLFRGRLLLLLVLGRMFTLAVPESVSTQDLLKSRVLDGTWNMTRYTYAPSAAPMDIQGHRNSMGSLGQGNCRKQEHITWKIDGKTFIQDSSTPETLFGSTGIWEIQSLVPIAGNSDHALKPELDPNYLKFRAYKDGTSPLDLCMATQVLAPETASSAMAAVASVAAIKTRDNRDVPQLTVMVDPSNPKQCPSRWVQFGGICAKGVDFLKGYCESGACLDFFKKIPLTPEQPTHSNTQPTPSGVGTRLSANWVGRVVVVISVFALHL